MKIGDRLKYSEYVIRPKRDYWLNCGREPMRSGAKEALDKAKALRGTVVNITSAQDNRLGVASMEVKSDDGSTHRCLPYLWEVAE